MSAVLTFSACVFCSAQRRVSADVQQKTVNDGKVSTVTKSVHCSSNGRSVTVYDSPVRYYMITNLKGESKFYFPDRNEVYSERNPELGTMNELIPLFLSGRIDDMGLRSFGYRQQSSSVEDGLLVRTFVNPTDANASVVKVVFRDYLPIFCEYTLPGGKVVNRTYYSNYQTVGNFTMPCRVTGIDYGSKKDSVVTRTLYSNVVVDGEDAVLDFEIPADAKPVQMPSKPVNGKARK